MPDKEKARLSVCDITILDDGKIISQQMSTTEDLAGPAASGSNTPSATTGIDLLIDNELILSTPQSPLLEVGAETGDVEEFLDSMFDCLQDDSSEQWPSVEEIAAAAGVSLCSPLITSYEIISAPEEPTGKEIVVSPGDDFFKFIYSCEEDSSTPQVPTPAQVTGNDEGLAGGSGVKFWEHSSPYHPEGNDGVGGSGVKFWECSSPNQPDGNDAGNDGGGGIGVKLWECSSPYHPDGNNGVGGSGVKKVQECYSPYCPDGNVGVGGSGVNFWECSSPHPPDFGANSSQFAGEPVDAASAECGCPPSPNPLMFDLYSPHMQAYFPSPPEDIATLIP